MNNNYSISVFESKFTTVYNTYDIRYGMINLIYYELFIKLLTEKFGTDSITISTFVSLMNSSKTKIEAFVSVYFSKLMTDKEKNKFLKQYYKTNRYYNALNRFGVICKYKYTKDFDCDFDICMNSLTNYKSSEIIKIIEDGRIYKFWGKDIYKLINKKLSNSCNRYAII